MRIGRQYPDGAQRRQALLGDIHALLLSQPLPANGQPGEIGHGRAADQAAAERFRQTQQGFQLRHGRQLDRGCNGIMAEQAILVCHANQPVRCDRRRGAAAGDEAEITRAGAGGNAGLITLPKALQRCQGAFAVFLQPIVARLQLLMLERWADRALLQPGQEILRQLAGVVEDLRKLREVLL